MELESGNVNERVLFLQQVIDTIRIMDAAMVSKQFFSDMLGSKADQGSVNSKVSYDEFGYAPLHMIH